MKIHPVFHVSLLEPAKDDKIPGRPPVPLPPIQVDDHEEWEIEAILDSRIHRVARSGTLVWDFSPGLAIVGRHRCVSFKNSSSL
ncbi:uncharacterized protein BJ171DRAFT_68891 [Polychytrium aggregatum]|uniref:uncharacterized protein n=1 Tax=Polychytrium aggregatum TaxID=110093 RepID=UPI0022FE7D82|nr:uncharacterized protein BJ171DRAFT_68891 [Polychytrium aggregatum]KAI9190668.1 hypothetical protein BJ171DRAFT_68891 [Polychytrium aggregatum]